MVWFGLQRVSVHPWNSSTARVSLLVPLPSHPIPSMDWHIPGPPCLWHFVPQAHFKYSSCENVLSKLLLFSFPNEHQSICDCSNSDYLLFTTINPCSVAGRMPWEIPVHCLGLSWKTLKHQHRQLFLRIYVCSPHPPSFRHLMLIYHFSNTLW